MAAITATDYTLIEKLVGGFAEANLIKRVSLIQSGAVREVTDASFSDGNVVAFRGDIPYATAWQSPTAATDATINKISKYIDYGVAVRRGDVFGTEDFALIAAGDEGAIARLGNACVNHAAWNVEQSISYVLQGAFTTGGPFANTSLGLVQANGPFSLQSLQEANRMKGEFASDMTMILMHSRVYYNNRIDTLVSNKDFATIREMQQMGVQYGGMLDGKMVIINDRLYNSGTTYHTYVVKPGAIMLGWQLRFETEAYRLPLKALGTDALVYRIAFCPHLVGMSYTGTAPTADAGATDANLYTATNWTARTSLTAAELGVIAIESTEA